MAGGPVTTWLVVPTAGTRAGLLEALVTDSGLPRDQVVVVATDPFAAWPDGVHHIGDDGPANIHRWWNTGIRFAEERGATVAVVANDDIVIAEQTIPDLVAALSSTGAALASPTSRWPGITLHVGPCATWPPDRVLDGALWALDLSTGLRPDETYSWWFGDNDLDLRARLHHGGVATVATAYRHVHPSEATFASPALMALTRADESLFRSRWQ